MNLATPSMPGFSKRVRSERTRRILLLATMSCSAAIASAVESHAFEFSISDVSVSDGLVFGNHAFIPVGATVTVGARFADPAATPLIGLGASYYGWDPAVLGYVAGDTVPRLFHQLCPIGGGGLAGTTNLVPSTPFLAQAAAGGPFAGTPRVRTIVAPAAPAKIANPNDPGLDGICGNGDAQMRLTFSGLADGETTLTIGTGDDLGGIVADGSGAILQATNASVVISVPEPGTRHALLVLITALAAAAMTRSRSARRMTRPGPRA